MIYKEACYGCNCDKCNERFESYYSGYSIFTDEEYLRESLAEDGWQNINGNWYCPNCCHYDEEKDEYVIND